MTLKEAEHQRTLAINRTMAKRATATPIEAEEQRVLARERSAARRAARVSEEVKPQQTVAYKTIRLRKTAKYKQTVMKRKPNQDAKVDWPKPIDMDCKINCLKNFIRHMSMDSLAESVCGICNVRRYKRDLRHVPLSKVPSIELLKIHLDLHNIIPKIQETNSFNSNKAAESERSSYIPDHLVNGSESNITTTVPITASAVLDVNGTTVSSDDVAEHLLGQMKIRIPNKTLESKPEETAAQDPVYMIPRDNKPVNEYSNRNLLLGVFPTLFPYGYGVLEDSSQPVPINFRDHVRYLLSFGDRRFEEHYSFIFVIFNILQRRTACFHAQLMTSRPYFQKICAAS
ncbi:unnamed protein product [Rotaria magnacalcarata]|uniref:Uncharacterized protein n=1 Tax=Rotaria magnacalcarata TaxID=392030 RepID=A0A820DMT2_9BILA|nr:unnamed protein product [Rotaria magnacalcarata]